MVKSRSQQTVGFLSRKKTFLSKDDKSSAGGIDVHAREVCAAINEREDAFTTSSCSGRAFLWRGEGVKSTSNFLRYRVTHELIPEGEPYFELAGLGAEVVDGAWEEIRRTREKAPQPARRPAPSCLAALASYSEGLCAGRCGTGTPAAGAAGSRTEGDPSVWLRFEPFILHVCCRDFAAAAAIIAAVRQVFKNVGVQSWSEGKVMLAIWGDEGLDMALTDGSGRPLFVGQAGWLQELVNSRHKKNWAKIDRLTEALKEAARAPVRGGAAGAPGSDGSGSEADAGPLGDDWQLAPARAGPRHFDVVGDVAVLSALPEGSEPSAVGRAVLSENHKVKVVALRQGALQSDHRKPGPLLVIAGPERRPLMTTHAEFGVRYVVNLEATFFNPRMGPERQRICGQVGPGERVLVLFSGCGPEALQLAAKTEADSVTAVELNPDAVRCARRGLELLAKQDPGRAGRVRLIEGDAGSAAAELEQRSFHRVLAPRPKAACEEEDARIADGFLRVLLPLLRPGGVCHWYDFVADWEFPSCERSTARIQQACARAGRTCSVLRCAPANNKPVAERQYRTVIDFAVDQGLPA